MPRTTLADHYTALIVARSAMMNPLDFLRTMLNSGTTGGIPSRVISEETGVPGSTIRAIRNGQSGNLKASTWGPLTVWVLEQDPLFMKCGWAEKKQAADAA